MKKFLYISLIASTIIIAVSQDIHSEQTQKDMFASVVVLPTFKLSLDNANITFGYTEPAKAVELYPQTHYNEVKCVSNKAKRWYLKLSVAGEIAGPPDSRVGVEDFKWMVARSTGDGVAEKGWRPFSKEPMLVYTSGEADSTGEEVVIQFKYRFDPPPKAKGGNYSLNVLYTMTDDIQQ